MSDTGTSRFANLFSPGGIGDVALGNRAVVAPMTRISAGPGGLATDEMATYYAEYAQGGFGLVITEGTYIDEAQSQGYVDQPGIANDAQRDSWKRVVDAVHAEGVPIFMQLLHAGALIQHNDYVGEAVAPSAVEPVGEMAPHYKGDGKFPIPREITRREMKDIAERFGAAAVRAIDAGFDGVEIHGANGYLADQFLTDYTNARDDEYGGPTARRVRYHTEIVAAVKQSLNGRAPFGIRISETKVNDLAHSWADGVDDAKTIFGAVGEAGPSYIHVNAHRGFEPVFGSGKSLARLAREAAPRDVGIVACGKLNDPSLADALLEDGTADAAAIAKGALADPHWPRKIARDETPVAFDPEMLRPYATLENVRRWKEGRGLRDAARVGQ